MLNVLPTIAALLSGIALLGLANGLMFTLLGIRMSLDGVSGGVIGLVGATYYAGMLAGTLWCGRIIRRVGHIRAFTVFAAVASIAALLHTLIGAAWVWAGLRAAMGVSSAGLYMIAESWLQYEASNENRGRVYALYAIASSAGVGAGPLLVNLGDPAGHDLFVVAAILLSLSLLPVALTRAGNPALGAPGRLGLRALIAISPVAVAGALAAGLISGAVSALGAVFGQRIGLAAGAIGLLMLSLRLGGFAMQYPFGAISDRFDRRRVMVFACLGVALAALGFAVFDDAGLPVLLVLGIAFGGFNQPIYGLAVSHAYDYLDASDFVAASAGLLFAFGVGASLGPLLATPAMAAFGPAGLFFYAAAVLLALAAFVVYRMGRRAPLPAEEQAEYVAVPPTIPATIATLDPRAEEAEADTEPEPRGETPLTNR